MLEVALAHGSSEWVRLLHKFMSERGIPSISEAGFSESAIREAREDRACRKLLLKQYRWDIVKPVLLAEDAARYRKKAARIIPTLGVSLATLLPQPAKLPTEWLFSAGTPGMWKNFRCWSLARLTGRWPSCVFGSPDLPLVLDECPWCVATNITLLHPFSSCSGASDRVPRELLSPHLADLS